MPEGGRSYEVSISLRRGSRADGIIRAIPILCRLDRLLSQAGASASVWWALLSMAACVAIAFALVRLLSALSQPSALMLAATLGVGLPVLDLALRRARRRRQFEEQLPGALDLLVRSLRAGDPLSGALATVAREMPDPLGSEFGIVSDEMAYGRAPDAALERLSEHIDLPDLHSLTIAIRIRTTVGGDLAESLDGLARAMRKQNGLSSGTSASPADLR